MSHSTAQHSTAQHNHTPVPAQVKMSSYAKAGSHASDKMSIMPVVHSTVSTRRFAEMVQACRLCFDYLWCMLCISIQRYLHTRSRTVHLVHCIISEQLQAVLQSAHQCTRHTVHLPRCQMQNLIKSKRPIYPLTSVCPAWSPGHLSARGHPAHAAR